jgi:sporulation protein YlmC with PRC-barrel domain
MKNTSEYRGKILKGLGWMTALGTLALTALAAEPPTHVDFRAVQQSVSAVGMEIKDLHGQALGKVKDFALDLENGRLVEVIVSSGGLLGMGQRNVAVPPGAFVFDPAGGVYRLNVDKEKFEAAPSFAMSKWTEHCQSRRVAEVYRYFGQEPYFAADGQGSQSGNTGTEPLGYVQRASKLQSLRVKNLQNEPLGSVYTFMFDLPKGRVFHVLVLGDGFLRTKSVIPARMFRFNAAHDALYLDLSTQAFHNEPRFAWTYGDKGDFQQEPYINTKVAANEGVNTRQNVHEGAANTYTPLAQGASFRDVDKTYRIYAAIQADASLSQNAQNVEVGTLNGRTTLRGHVNTEEGRRAIGKIVAAAGYAENVSNLLEVRPLPVTIKQAN